MANHNNPIERALERLESLAQLHPSFRKKCRTILTDLAAEKYAEGERAGSKKVIPWMNHVTRYKARLAAVVERAEFGIKTGSDMHRVICEKFLALARGEGGEQASGVKDEAAHDRGCDQASVPTEPAAPDVPQITMHAYDPPRGLPFCKQCGFKAEHPCHGETKPQQSPASDGGLDEIVRDAVREKLRSAQRWWRSYHDSIVYLELEAALAILDAPRPGHPASASASASDVKGVTGGEVPDGRAARTRTGTSTADAAIAATHASRRC